MTVVCIPFCMFNYTTYFPFLCVPLYLVFSIFVGYRPNSSVSFRRMIVYLTFSVGWIPLLNVVICSDSRCMRMIFSLSHTSSVSCLCIQNSFRGHGISRVGLY